jgi:hypothetical protein
MMDIQLLACNGSPPPLRTFMVTEVGVIRTFSDDGEILGRRYQPNFFFAYANC